MYCIDAVHIHTEYIIRAIYLYTSRVLSMNTYGVPHQAANWKPANLRFQRPATQNEYGKFKYTCHRPLLHQCLVGTKLAHWYCSRISQITGQQPAQMPLRKQRKRINRCVFFCGGSTKMVGCNVPSTSNKKTSLDWSLVWLFQQKVVSILWSLTEIPWVGFRRHDFLLVLETVASP